MRLLLFTALAGVNVVVVAQGPGSSPYPGTTYPKFVDPVAAAGAKSGQKSPPRYPSPWQDGSGGWAQAVAQAQAFVKKLTVAEKVNLTTGAGWQSERCIGQTGEIPRLGFRGFCVQDSPLGVRKTDNNSAFPAGGTVAASWDRNIWYQRGFDMGSEHHGKGIDVQLGPVVGPIGRSPEGGRNWEGFSPDPVLAGIAVAETVKGIQAAGTIACTKHFIGNEQEHFRHTISSNIADITMHELYLWPFADAIRAGTGSIMCSYNQVNNSFACQNSYTLNYLLKNELGFQGFVMSDFGAQESGVASALAGLDQSMPGDEKFDSGNSYWGTNLTIAILNGTVPMYRLNDMATRIMAAYYYVNGESDIVDINFSSWTNETDGYFYYESQTDFGEVNEHVDVQGNHASDIRSMAAMSTVLLKNTGNVLPLDVTKQSLTAVIGNDAGANPGGPNACSDRGCDNGTLAMGWGSGTANFPYLITPLDAITNEVNTNGTGGQVQGIIDNYATASIQSLASKASVALVFVNSDSGEGYITVDGNAGDRNNLTAWINGDALIETVAAQCSNTIVVYHSVGAVLMTAWYDNPNVTAILWAGLPGQESGNSIADVIYGRVNPGGKLPFTLGQTRESYGTDILYKTNAATKGAAPQDNFEEGNFIDYRAFDKFNETPIYEFGFGLSYTTFAFSNLKVVKKANIPPYKPNSGKTAAAPSFGKKGTASDYLFPKNGFQQLKDFIYPFLSSTNLKVASGDSQYGSSVKYPKGATDSDPQPKVAAGGAPGGNPGLYDVLFTVSATITNTGKVDGDEVPQLYVSLGGPDDPKRVLRNFDRITIPAGQSSTFKATITRRDLSNWLPKKQDWAISSYKKTVYVGSSSRKLPLHAVLPTVS